MAARATLNSVQPWFDSPPARREVRWYLRRQRWRQRPQWSAPWRSRRQPCTLAHPAWAGHPLHL